MKTNKSIKMIMAGLIGCGLCCLALILPVAAGLMGASILGFAFNQILCAVFLLFLAVAGYGIYLSKKKSACTVPTDNNA